MKAIIRTAKLKTWGNVAGSGSHIARQRETANADPDAPPPVRLVGTGNPEADVRSRIEGAGVRVAKNAVLAVEVLMTASPEYFRPDHPERAGSYAPARLKAWQQAVTDWARDRWGDNLVSMTVHLDEATPHAHAVVVPINPKTNRLSAKAMITGGRKMLAELQDSYAGALAPLGLERGQRGSKAKHETIKRVYGALSEPPPAPMMIPVPPAAILEGTRREWAEQQRQEQAERERILRDQAAAGRVARMLVRDQGAAIEAERAEAETQRQATEVAKAEADRLRAQMQQQADRLRALDLALVLEAAGLKRDQADKRQWLGEAHRISIEGPKWYDHDQSAGGGGAIDLAMHLTGSQYRDAVAWLASVAGDSSAIEAEAARAAAEAAREAARAAVGAGNPSAPPQPYSATLEHVRHYLTAVRGLDAELVDWCIEQGAIYSDRRGNAVFRYGNKNEGVELRGTGPRKWRGFRGRKSAAFAIQYQSGPPTALAVTESAIDALAYARLHPQVQVLAVGGSGSAVLFDAIGQMAETAGLPIIMATDADEAGEAMVGRLVNSPGNRRRTLDIRRDRPQGYKDWGEQAQADAQRQAPTSRPTPKGPGL